MKIFYFLHVYTFLKLRVAFAQMVLSTIRGFLKATTAATLLPKTSTYKKCFAIILIRSTSTTWPNFQELVRELAFK